MFSLIREEIRPGFRPGKNTIMPVMTISTRLVRMKMVSQSMYSPSSTSRGRVTQAPTAHRADSTATTRHTHSASGISSASVAILACSASGMATRP